MASPLVFAVLSGVSVAAYTVCVKVGSSRVNPALGALVVVSAAALVNLVVLAGMRAAGHPIHVTPRGVAVLALAGVAAAGIDFFGLLAFSRGLQVSAALIITGTQTALVLLAGFLFLREPFTWPKLLGVLLVLAGIAILHREGG